ncbi:GtrA family protein [Natronoarchaeum mannanilyticum]|uniref:GtrA family protein n=1 Tax=Natronoarchaeum mannanilyticum TaxID=926360 RepID=A0AAV3TEA4_9EURY
MAGESTLRILQNRVRAMLSSGRLLRFATVGVAGTTVDFAILIALVELHAFPPAIAKLVGAETAIIVMFLVNEHWTFSEWGRSGIRPLLRRLLTSNLVRTGGLVVATGVLALLVYYGDVQYLLANAVGIACGFVVNFLAESYFTWRVHR